MDIIEDSTTTESPTTTEAPEKCDELSDDKIALTFKYWLRINRGFC